MNGLPSFSLIMKPSTVVESTKGLILIFSIETSRPNCFVSTFTATRRMIGGKIRKPKMA